MTAPFARARSGARRPAKLGGVSLLPMLAGHGTARQEREYHWEAAPQQALRSGDCKIYRAARDQPVELYDLARDVGETKNVASQHPEIAGRLGKLPSTARTESAEFPLRKKQKAKASANP